MNDSALDRVARALDLIPFLTANPGLSISEIAQQFDTTPIQISRDLSLLHMCGLPGYSHLELLDIDYQDPEYVSVADPQVLDKPRALTYLESLALVLGLTLLEELTNDKEELGKITAFRERLSQLIGDRRLNERGPGFELLSTEQAVKQSPYALTIAQAITRESAIAIEYTSATSDTHTRRLIYPRRLIFKDGVGYCEALSEDQQAYRTFRLDRITQIDPHESGQPQDHQGGIVTVTQSEPSQPFQILIPKEGFAFLETHAEIIIDSQFDGQNYRLLLQVESGEWLLRTLLALPYPATVLAPLDWANTLSSRLEDTYKHYQG
jgi:proteasome accessory factor C